MSKIRFETKTLHLANKMNPKHNLDSMSSFSDFIDLPKEEVSNSYNEFLEKSPCSINQELIQKLCELENTEAGILCSSGSFAIYQTLIGLTKLGDHILVSKTCSPSIYKVVVSLSQKNGVSFSFIDFSKPKTWKSHVKQKTKLVLFETISTPSLEVPDFELLKIFSDEHSLYLVADNSNSTPFLLTPSDLGVHCIIYSNTSNLDSHSGISAGIILGQKKCIKKIQSFHLENEFVFSSFNSWVLSRGLETLAVRMERHSSNALRVAEYLEKVNGVLDVQYPYLSSFSNFNFSKKYLKMGGSNLNFSLEGGVVRGKRFINSLKSFLNTTSPSIRTVSHLATSSYLSIPENVRMKMGVNSSMIRLSIGLEHIDDIIEEIDSAISDSKIVFKLYKKGY